MKNEKLKVQNRGFPKVDKNSNDLYEIINNDVKEKLFKTINNKK